MTLAQSPADRKRPTHFRKRPAQLVCGSWYKIREMKKVITYLFGTGASVPDLERFFDEKIVKSAEETATYKSFINRGDFVGE